jgi:signal transduction histidine kinase/CheY-like chemotaxis protein
MTWGILLIVYRPISDVIDWWRTYYQRAQELLEQAQDRQANLTQTLEDLANANRQLSRLNLLTQRLHAEAEEARRAKEQFVANVSHELRTPLNMIIGFSEIMLGSPISYGRQVPSSLLADLAVVHRNAEHLKDLIDDVLDLSQIEANQMALTREHVRFQDIVETAVVAVRPLFASKGLYLETDVPPDLPPVLCDPTRMREVLLNLLSNAGRYTQQGGVRVRVWRAGNQLLVSVQDTGRGIATDDLNKLFQPFQQLDGSIHRRYGGTGLGLSISKRFIELHQGKIWAESQPGAGATFTFQIPQDEPPPSEIGDFSRWLTPDWEFVQRTVPSKAPRSELRHRLVLWESGPPTLRRLLDHRWADTEVVSVSNLDAALAALAETSSQALVVNDSSVAGALERLGSATLPYGVLALVCSVAASADSADALGVSDYLVKPVSQGALLAALDRLSLPVKSILIVDDEPDALQLFRRVLNSSGRGYRVLLARSGREALDVLRETQPDVVLLDLIMPNMDGFQLLTRCKDDPSLRRIPVLVISAQDPAGQPIVSSVLAVTHRGGLSARQLLTSIRALSQAIAGTGPIDDRVQSARQSG